MNKAEVEKFIFDNKQAYLAELEKQKEIRKNSRNKRPCVFLACVGKVAASHAVPNPPPKIEVRPYHVTTMKNSTFINLIRTGKYPIGYEFPTDSDLQLMRDNMVKQGSSDNEFTASGQSVELLKNADPFKNLRAWLDGIIGTLLNKWKLEEDKSNLELRIAEVERREAEVKAKEAAEKKSKDKKETKKLKKELKKDDE